MNNIATINGLRDGISVLEHDNKETLTYQTDLLYASNEPVDLGLQEMYYDEGYTVTHYQPEDFGQAVTLLSTITMEQAILGATDTI
jgi:hypothetical protein